MPCLHRPKMSDYVPIKIMDDEDIFSDISEDESKETKQNRESNQAGCIVSSSMMKPAIYLI